MNQGRIHACTLTGMFLLAGCHDGSAPTQPQSFVTDGGSTDAGDSGHTGLDGSRPGFDAGKPTEDSGASTGDDATVNPGDDAGTNPGDDAGTNPGDDAGGVTDHDAGGGPLDGGNCPDGQGLCPMTPFNNEPTSNYQCRPLVDGMCPAPDLVIFGQLVVDDGDGNTIHLTTQDFAATAPEVMEGCVNGTGSRRLLAFNFAAVNLGTENMNVGRPNEADTVHWEWFEAHHHFHVKGWGDYRVRTPGGMEVGHGHKQSFCLEDNVRMYDNAGPRQFPPPLCENFDPNEPYDQRPEFGLSVGWGDEYPSDVRCQWVDLGPSDPSAPDFVPDGIYDLTLSVNLALDGSHLYRESNYDNDTFHVRVQITGNTVQACDDHTGDACASGHVACDGSCAAP